MNCSAVQHTTFQGPYRYKYTVSGRAALGPAFSKAASEGKVTEVQGLIGCPEIDINYAGSSGQTGLWNAAWKGHLEVVQLLLSTPGIYPNKATTADRVTPLFMASQEGHEDIVRALLADKRVDPNIPRTEWKDTPLIMAAIKERVEVVKILLRCPKVDITPRDKEGDNALDEAKKNGNAEIEQAILSRKTLLKEGHTC